MIYSPRYQGHDADQLSIGSATIRKAAPRDLSIEEISGETGIHRNTVSKYVYPLEKEGKIILTRQVGGAKFYTVKEK